MKKKKSKMGRPPMPRERRRSKIIRLRLTEGELARLESEARKSGKSLSAVIREKLGG